MAPQTPDASSGAGAGGSLGLTDRIPLESGDTRHRVEPLDLVITLFGLALLGTFGFFAGRVITNTMGGGVRVVLGGTVAGLTGYIYYGLSGPGAHELYDLLDHLAPLTAALTAGLLGLISAWWMLRREW
jgi:hypothetical protein